MSNRKTHMTVKETDLLFDCLRLACDMANNIKLDVEEDPMAASNTTLICVNDFINKMDTLNDLMDSEDGGLN